MNPASALDMFRIIVAAIKARGNDILTIGGSLLAVQHMIKSGWLVTYSPYVVDSRPSRVALLILIAAIGFGIGFFISPQARELRRLCMLSLVTIAIGTAVADQGTYGWLATLVACIMLFAMGVGAGLNSIRRAFFETSTHGSSDWATAQHLIDNRVIRQDGIRLGYVEIRGQMRVIRYDGERHLVTTAPTRGGKGVNFIIPNLLELTDRSCLVVDPKGENAIITAAHRARSGQEVFVVDPWGIASASGFKPARFNPIDWLKGSGIDMTENALILADALVMSSNSEQDQFWVEEAKALIAGLLLYVATDPDEEGQRNLGRVRELLLLDGADMPRLFQHMAQSPNMVVASTGARSLQKEEKLLANVIASAQAQTHFLDSLRIRESLSASDFQFEDLKTKPMTIYLVLPADRLITFGRWLRLLIQQAITVNARNIAVKPDKPILFIVDEMPSLGRLTMLEQAFSLMAGFGLQIWAFAQDTNKIKALYGDAWEGFFSNAGVASMMQCRDVSTCEYFSTLCGVKTVWTFSSAMSRTFGSNAGGSNNSTSNSTTSSENSSAVQRKLIFPDEIGRLPDNRMILLIDNLQPIMATKIAWFDDPTLRDLGQPLSQAA